MSAPHSPLLGADGPPAARRARAVKGIAREITGFVALTIMAPLTFIIAAFVDLALWLRHRKPWMTVRLIALLWWCLLGELRGLVGVLGVWILAGGPRARDTETRRRRMYRLQVRWATWHVRGFVWLYGVRLSVEGDELVGAGPMIVFTRHASLVDNGLPALVVSQAHGIDLRYALKSELQSLPTLDLGARWVPTCFVQRASADPDREMARVRMLATGLHGPRAGVLLYPEGTLHTARKLAALQARTDLADPELRARIARLRHVLPPRLGGPLAVLDEAPHAAVVFCGHAGLDVHNLREIWAGDVGRTWRVRFWRHESRDLPQDAATRATWLYDRWLELDDWVGAPDSAPGPVPAPSPAGKPYVARAV